MNPNTATLIQIHEESRVTGGRDCTFFLLNQISSFKKCELTNRKLPVRCFLHALKGEKIPDMVQKARLLGVKGQNRVLLNWEL